MEKYSRLHRTPGKAMKSELSKTDPEIVILKIQSMEKRVYSQAGSSVRLNSGRSRALS